MLEMEINCSDFPDVPVGWTTFIWTFKSLNVALDSVYLRYLSLVKCLKPHFFENLWEFKHRFFKMNWYIFISAHLRPPVLSHSDFQNAWLACRPAWFRSRQRGPTRPPAACWNAGWRACREPPSSHIQHGAVQSDGSEPRGIAGERETGWWLDRETTSEPQLIKHPNRTKNMKVEKIQSVTVWKLKSSHKATQ